MKRLMFTLLLAGGLMLVFVPAVGCGGSEGVEQPAEFTPAPPDGEEPALMTDGGGGLNALPPKK